VRVIAGSAKGRELRGPKAPKSGPARIRPTSDKVREALFDILAPYVEGARILDLYAGTGALAIEALSRGAASAELVEDDHQAHAIIRENLANTGLQEHASVRRMKVEKALPLLDGQYDVILADPPYADAHLASLVCGLDSLVKEQGHLVVEHSSRTTLADEFGSLQLWKRRRHGDTTLSIYRKS
jgi:16S rRNA (guanine966-N2)-methyltransferase